MNIEKTAEEISGIEFVTPTMKAAIAVGDLFGRFPKKWQRLNAWSVMKIMSDGAKNVAFANTFTAENKHEQEEILEAILAARGSFSVVETMLESYLEDTPGFIKQAQPDDNFATLEDISNVRELLLETLNILDKVYKFETKVYDKLD